ncbi:MAG: hypothetical protein A2309_02880 [Bacteroidetes bacterium RIFOXYB2_FULL_35_7]|nr:MAG: hypothetical protein A2309_02880 [Bacteroidetes bacterium RIFOXYB2_FULL_35_7]
MALKKIESCSDKSSDGILLDVNNGDLQALLDIQKKWGFKSESEVLRYALAIMAQADKQVLYIDKEGSKVGLVPTEDLIIKKE